MYNDRIKLLWKSTTKRKKKEKISFIFLELTSFTGLMTQCNNFDFCSKKKICFPRVHVFFCFFFSKRCIIVMNQLFVNFPKISIPVNFVKNDKTLFETRRRLAVYPINSKRATELIFFISSSF